MAATITFQFRFKKFTFVWLASTRLTGCRGAQDAIGVEEFTYLGSKQCSTGYCRPDMLRRMGLACTVMVSMQTVWKCSYLNTSTKIHLYQALIMSVLLYSAETWTLLRQMWRHWMHSIWNVSDRYLTPSGGNTRRDSESRGELYPRGMELNSGERSFPRDTWAYS